MLNKLPFRSKLSPKIIFILLTLFLLIILIISLPNYFTFTYIKRIVLYRESDINDYKIFPARNLDKSSEVFVFNNNLNPDISRLLSNLTYKSQNKNLTTGDFDKFLEDNGTTSFIIIKNDNIIYEKYFNRYSRDSINTSVSMAKSLTSALIGIAIDEGHIKNVNEPITNYLPELKSKGFDKTTIKDLLEMSSNINYKEGFLMFGDDAKTYYSDDLRKLVLDEVKINPNSKDEFLYNNYHPLILGIIIERSTGQKVGDYLNNKIWKEIGTEFDGSWSLDSEKNSFEKMESGINARSIDFAKFGRLFLNKGKWNDTTIISENWVKESTQPTNKDKSFYKSLESWNVDLDKTAYSYLWWNYKRDESKYDFYARGKYGQYIYISPETNTIIVRNGFSAGEVEFWPEIFFQITNKI